MKEHPIIFNDENILLLLSGCKTQTRRVVKPQPSTYIEGRPYWDVGGFKTAPDAASPLICPYGRVGDRLWVRETYAKMQEGDLKNQSYAHFYYGKATAYKADCGIEVLKLGGNFTPQERDFKWRPSIFMPRTMSRITLRIISRRVERVQDITEADAEAEGLETMTPPNTSKRFLAPECGKKPPEWEADSRAAFMWLWDSINDKCGYGWDVNPLVWVVEFKNVS